jgi:nucleotide-binding universal stress UspA family protein
LNPLSILKNDDKGELMQIKIKKILFPTDLSKGAVHAFQYAGLIATLNRAEIIILHVLEDIPKNIEATLANYLGYERIAEIISEKEQNARSILIGKRRESILIREALEKFCQTPSSNKSGSVEPPPVSEIIVKSGEVVGEINRLCRDLDCDLIVMAYENQDMVAKTLGGGKTRRVLRQSRVPVLLVPT